ncbi:VOC family protein [Halalkalibacillus halophilus]|uniref:VOC family protein n=1 Tax=Halalkalibacillus halophilus TaxID=392827 RepID=UPI0004290BC5|nr:VOC family protein [Halalkalibacillus halophilus]
MELDNTRLLVTKFDACFQFYKEILELNVTWGEIGSGYASFEAGNGKIFAIFSRKEMAEAVHTENLPSTPPAQDRFALIFRKENGIEKLVEKLRKEDVTIVNELTERPDWGIKTIHLRDPDGNLLEIVTELPKDNWSPHLLEEDEKF